MEKQTLATTEPKVVSGRDFYERLYQSDLEQEAQWLQYGAIEKVNSVEMLLKQRGITANTLLELGCGTGAVIIECQRRGLAKEFTAIDYSKKAIEFLESHSTGIQCISADITDPDFKLDRSFDVVVLSHVLEHLEEALRFLQLLRNRIRFQYLVVEVPLEDLWASRIKNLFRDRTRNPAGHVQFFTESTFRQLLSSANFEMTDYRRYVHITSMEALKLVARRSGSSGLGMMVMKGTRYYLPRLLRPLWQIFYYSHFAVLCIPRLTGGWPTRKFNPKAGAPPFAGFKG